MDTELKVIMERIENNQKAMCGKLDATIKHQKEICKLKHDPINIHLVDGMKFRDKVVANGIWIVSCWTIVILLLGRTLWKALASMMK